MTDTKEKELKELMLAALNGDQIAYKKFLEQTCQVLRGFLSNIFSSNQRSKEKVDDLVQETLIAIHRKRDLYSKDMAILPWIHAIARYRMIDQMRADARRPKGVEWDYKVEALTATELQDHSSDQGDALLEGLTEKQKLIVRLAKVDEVPLAEIALSQKMSLSAVKVCIHRAIHVMRENVEKKAANGD
jgi:RNA polymerase sigma-70 factor (ECF subfamily)